MGAGSLEIGDLGLLLAVTWVPPATWFVHCTFSMSVNELELKIIDQSLDNLIDIVISELVSGHDACLLDEDMKLLHRNSTMLPRVGFCLLHNNLDPLRVKILGARQTPCHRHARLSLTQEPDLPSIFADTCNLLDKPRSLELLEDSIDLGLALVDYELKLRRKSPLVASIIDCIENHLLLYCEVFDAVSLFLAYKSEKGSATRATALKHLDSGPLNQTVQDVYPLLIWHG